MSLILQQHARRILVYNNKSYCSMFRYYGAISSPEANQPLQSRIKAALNQKAQIIPVLDQWQQEGNQVKPLDIRGLIKNLLDSNRFSQALEASQWMGEEKVCTIFPKDYAARLHLTEKVLGLEEAKKFFNSVYSTLLTFYTKSEETLDNAELTFKKMRELGFLLKPSPYNSMISLYTQLGKIDMADKLLYEMEENKVKLDNVTAKNVLRAHFDNLCDVKVVDHDKKNVKLDSDTINAIAKAISRYNSEGMAKYKKPGKKGKGFRIVMSFFATLGLLMILPPVPIPLLMVVPLFFIPFLMFYWLFEVLDRF